MRDNSFDRTIERNYLQKWRFLIAEYEDVKSGKSQQFRRVGDFYRHHGTCSQTFRKYYNRYLTGCKDADLLPRRRGPRWRTRRTPAGMEALVARQRELGQNKYEIFAALKEMDIDPPSVSTIYRILCRLNLNRRNPPMVEEKRRIIKEKMGELGHVDLHQVPKDVFLNLPSEQCYVLTVIDSFTRLAWAELVISKKSLPVMFKSLKIINTLNYRYGLKFEEIMTDNGAEFASKGDPDAHPFECMLGELGIRHRYTKPYRPQTNGKVERFWRTLDDDLIEGTTFDDHDHFVRELLEYMIYYNEFRPHQALDGVTPKAYAQETKTR
jgi:transposase InsO family protein